MKTIASLRRSLGMALGAFSLMFGSAALVGCSESIDEGNYAISTEQTVSDLLAATDTLSHIKAIFDRVRLGDSDNASSITSVLAARGNYTVFVPSNSAVDYYIDSIGVASVAELTYEQAQLIANSCVIDNGTQQAYESADFPTPGTFPLSNLNDRLLSCELITTDTDNYYVVNGTSPVVNEDNEVSNGVVHVVSRVIAPSSDLVPEMIASADNLKIMAYLLAQTHVCDSLMEFRDETYEETLHDEVLHTASGENLTCPDHRYLGYTGFVETDDVFRDEWGIELATDDEGNVTNWDDVMAIVQTRCEAIYASDEAAAAMYAASGDLTNPDNAVNRFVAYHFVKGRLGYDRLVRHCNEYNYQVGDWRNPQTNNCPTDVWDYYPTIGKYRGLIKVLQAGESGPLGDPEHTIYLNRTCVYNDERDGDYSVAAVSREGIVVSSTNGQNDNNALNGFYYPINHILSYDLETRRQLSSERMRIDMVTFLPELMSNNIRGVALHYFPNGYFENILNESSGTDVCYLFDTYGGSWRDYQGDEVWLSGRFDAIFRLPPVPLNGTYEIRLGISLNPLRGMGQMYFGSDPVRLSPIGLPLDMRQSMNNNPAIPWVADGDDEQVNLENDRNMRNQGFMKAPQYFTITNGRGDTPVRGVGGAQSCIRAILTTQNLRANETYYIRMKSALNKQDSQWFLDYIEYVPTSVYNGAQAEDIW